MTLLVLTERPHPTRLFLKKRRTSLPCPVQSRSENALAIGRSLMAATTILLVDDNAIIRFTLSKLLRDQGFEVTAAGSVVEALTLISSEVYDVLLSDLHMPGAGDGLTVVSAMRHSNPKAVTMLLSGFPEME